MAANQLTSPAVRRVAAWLLLVLLSSGCARWRPASPNASEAPWTNSWRTKADSTSGAGIDSRAKEIERNLGVY